MLSGARAFSGFSANDIEAAKRFYGETLGVDVSEENGSLNLRFPGGQRVFIYPKENHEPATYTALDVEVEDIDATVDRLVAAGVSMERYSEEFGQDARGISRTPYGPPIAWFKDPAGNIIALIETGAMG